MVCPVAQSKLGSGACCGVVFLLCGVEAMRRWVELGSWEAPISNGLQKCTMLFCVQRLRAGQVHTVIERGGRI